MVENTPCILSPDFIVIGSGIAGLRAAIALARSAVLILTKAAPTESNTGTRRRHWRWASTTTARLCTQGHIQAAMDCATTTPAAWLVEQGRPNVTELVEWGTALRSAIRTDACLAAEAHSVRRVLHAGDTRDARLPRPVATGQCAAIRARRRTTHGHRGTRRGRPRHGGQIFRPLVPTRRPGGAPRCWHGRAATSSARRQIRRGRRRRGPRVPAARRVATSSSSNSSNRAHVRGAAILISEALAETAQTHQRPRRGLMSLSPRGDLAPRDVSSQHRPRDEWTGASVFLSLSHLDANYVVNRFRRLPNVRRINLDLASDPIPVGRPRTTSLGGVDTDHGDGRRFPGCSPRRRSRAPASTARTARQQLAARRPRVWRTRSHAMQEKRPRH